MWPSWGRYWFYLLITKPNLDWSLNFFLLRDLAMKCILFGIGQWITQYFNDIFFIRHDILKNGCCMVIQKNVVNLRKRYCMDLDTIFFFFFYKIRVHWYHLCSYLYSKFLLCDLKEVVLIRKFHPSCPPSPDRIMCW